MANKFSVWSIINSDTCTHTVKPFVTAVTADPVTCSGMIASTVCAAHHQNSFIASCNNNSELLYTRITMCAHMFGYYDTQ